MGDTLKAKLNTYCILLFLCFLFKEGIEQWKTGLDEKRLKSSKTFFLHHLLFEMWLDRILLNSNPEAGIEMYQNSKSDIELLENVINQIKNIKVKI
jgi:hypothetical protein